MRRGAFILCGGQSERMGRDKAALPFGPGETMLERVVRLVGEAVPNERIVCVAAPGQKLPQLPAVVAVAFDPLPHRGPLAGLAAGMKALKGAADAVFITGCDAPLLKPGLVERMFDLLGDFEITAPHDGQHWHPLAGVYRTNLQPQIGALLGAGQGSLVALLNACRSRRVPTDELREVDPGLESLATCNTPEEYRRALQASGNATSQ